MSKVGKRLVVAVTGAAMVAGSAMADTNIISDVQSAITTQVDLATVAVKALLVLAGGLVAIFVGFKLLKRGAGKI